MKKATLQEWKGAEETKKAQQLQERQEAEAKKKEAEFNLKTYDYAVLKEGKIEHRTPHLQEAINLARTINAKVWWAVEGDLVSEVSLTK